MEKIDALRADLNRIRKDMRGISPKLALWKKLEAEHKRIAEEINRINKKYEPKP